jgi:hypothetical protein
MILTDILWESFYKERVARFWTSLCQLGALAVMSTDWMKLERALAHAEARLVRRLRTQAWLVQFHKHKKHKALGVGRKWETGYLVYKQCPGYLDKSKRYVCYDDIAYLSFDAKVLVLRLRALKYHGSLEYIDPRYTKLPCIWDYPDLLPTS